MNNLNKEMNLTVKDFASKGREEQINYLKNKARSIVCFGEIHAMNNALAGYPTAGCIRSIEDKNLADILQSLPNTESPVYGDDTADITDEVSLQAKAINAVQRRSERTVGQYNVGGIKVGKIASKGWNLLQVWFERMGQNTITAEEAKAISLLCGEGYASARAAS